MRVRGTIEAQEAATVHERSVGGLIRRAKKKFYIDDKGRRWETNEIETKPKHALDENGAAIPLFGADGKQERDPETGLLRFENEYNRNGNVVMEPVMVMDWVEPDTRLLSWAVGKRMREEFGEEKQPFLNVDNSQHVHVQPNDPDHARIMAGGKAYEEAERRRIAFHEPVKPQPELAANDEGLDAKQITDSF